MFGRSRSGFIFAIFAIALTGVLIVLSVWLVDSWLVFPIIFYEIAIIFLLYLLMNNFDFTFPSLFQREKEEVSRSKLGKIREVITYQLRIPTKSSIEEAADEGSTDESSIEISGYHIFYHTKFSFSMNYSRVLEILILLTPVVALVFTLSNINIEILLVILALICTSIVPGYSTLKLTSIGSRLSKLELLVFSVIVSYLLTGFLWFILLFIAQSLASSLFLLLTSILGITAIFKNNENFKRRSSFSTPIDMVIVVSILFFFVFSWLMIYPGFLMIPNSDVVRHYASSLVLARSPSLYLDYAYLLAHLHQSAYLYISNASFLTSQIGLLSLNLALPLAFYIFARRSFDHIDKRIPVISTIFWVLFTPVYGGFSWGVYVLFKIISPSSNQSQIIQSTANMTYNGNIYALFGLWYVPLTLSLTMLLCVMSLMRNNDLDRKSFVILFSTITAGMFLVHVTEALFFAIFLGIYALFFRGKTYRITDSLVSTIVGLLLVLVVYFALSLTLVRFIMSSAGLISLALPLSAVISAVVIRKTKLHRIILGRMNRLGQILLRNNVQVGLQSIIFFCFGISAIVWFWNQSDFQLSQVNSVGLIPWFMYPLIIGITGLLSILSIKRVFTANDTLRSTFTFFISFLLIAFVFGRMLSFVNLTIMNTSYWEKRFLIFIKISLAVISPIWFLNVFDKLSTMKHKPTTSRFNLIHTISKSVRLTTSWLVIAIVVIGGLSTSLLSLGYWNYTSTNAFNQSSSIDMDSIEHLQDIFDTDPYSWLFTPTLSSDYITSRAAPADHLGAKILLNTALTPEMALMLLYRHPIYSHPYIYVANRDQQLLDEYSDSFIGNHLSVIPAIYNTSQVTIYDSPKLSFPQGDSNIALALPPTGYLTSSELLTSYYAMSGGYFDYTTVSESDPSLWDYDTIVLPYDLPLMDELVGRHYIDFTDNWDEKFGEWIIGTDTLVGGSPIGESAGVITSSFEADSFHASFDIDTALLNESVLNYAGLVYSFQNSTNMKIAEIMFGIDGFIYAFTNTVNNANPVFGSANPTWPGINTGISWLHDTVYKISIDIAENSTQILINEQEVLWQQEDNPRGKIGFFYYRPNQIEFSNLVLETNNITLTKSASDFMDFVQQGGTLIVLNTNGYGFFADNLFHPETNIFEVASLNGFNTVIELPNNLIIQSNTLKISPAEMVANYTSQQGSESVYITKENFDYGTLLYTNIFPLLSSINETNRQEFTSGVLMQALSFLNLTSLSDVILSWDGYTESIVLENATLQTSSAIFPYNSGTLIAEIHMGESEIHINNIVSIRIECSQIEIKTDHLVVSNGAGFYANCSFDDTIGMIPLEINRVTIFTHDEMLEYENVSLINITPVDEVNLLLRLPSVFTESATFEGLYTQSGSLGVVGASGQTMTATGGVKFDIGVSDVYTILHHVQILGEWYLDPPQVQFNEMQTFFEGLQAGLMLLPTLPVVYWALGGRFSLHRFRKTVEENDKK